MSSSRNRRKKRNKGQGPNQTPAAPDRDHGSRPVAVEHADGRLTEARPGRRTETRPSRRTTELMAYVGAALAVVLTALAVDRYGPGLPDPFGTDLAVQFVVLLTLGYLVARGLAKTGRREGRSHRADVVRDDAGSDARHDDVDHEHARHDDVDHEHARHDDAGHDDAGHDDVQRDDAGQHDAQRDDAGQHDARDAQADEAHGGSSPLSPRADFSADAEQEPAGTVPR